MWRPLPHRAVWLLALLASTALAQDRAAPAVRTLLISDHPAEEAHRIGVAGQVATVLRFEQPCDAAKTRLLGWEGRFEPPIVMGRLVVLVPVRDLAEDERIPLLVTLADGTELPFLVGPPREREDAPDQQVNVFRDRESYHAVLSALNDSLGRERDLRSENERFKKEETSADHALATLLASGAIQQTPFRATREWLFEEPDADVKLVAFSGKAKAAVLVKVRNRDPRQHWSLKQARLTTLGGQLRTVAVRSTLPSIPPGQEGRLAFIVDKEAFNELGRPTQLVLEIFRHDGLLQAQVVLDPRLTRE
ncbi:DUF2381 family protein [Pyxidicoccus parkwayensis]|uniref:DUF2381 family protein n=1 Tax=Pyxidicoccus parkwayensis TaxID=2813578 RepID=A0ABX7P152_9BACT|nr:DUF2381 family protein [Pyxidicoccus parkwaysis]QSQ23494.1 DUF2381 family protein [Pyxidicoccus parkwaysis]